MKLQSKKGMTVEIPGEKWAELQSTHGDKAREVALTMAARSLEHSQSLVGASAELTDEQMKQVLRVAHANKKQQLVINKVVEMGYEEYAVRYLQGRMMPDSWGRIYDNAKAEAFDRPSLQSLRLQGVSENAKRQIQAIIAKKDFYFQVELNQDDLDMAAQDLGFTTARDIDYSQKVANICSDWLIVAP